MTSDQQKEQSQRFIGIVREYKCDEPEDTFLGKIKKLSGHKLRPDKEEKS